MAKTFAELEANQTLLEEKSAAEKVQVAEYVEAQKQLNADMLAALEAAGTPEQRDAFALRQEALIAQIEGIFTPEVTEPPVDPVEPSGRVRR